MVSPYKAFKTFQSEVDAGIEVQHGDHPRGDNLQTVYMVLGFLMIAKAILVAAELVGDQLTDAMPNAGRGI